MELNGYAHSIRAYLVAGCGRPYWSVFIRMWFGSRSSTVPRSHAMAKDLHSVGPSGSGKTTLAAGLMRNGFDYLADDLVAISAPMGTIVPWPMPLSIKPGSIDVITNNSDELSQAPSYRTKGVVARLLVPPSATWDSEPVKLRCLIFPRFADGAVPQLQRISSFQAIECLLRDRICIGSPITADRVASFLAWLDDTPAYLSVYGSLDDGMRHIQDLAT
jgi:hypothetical protein